MLNKIDYKDKYFIIQDEEYKDDCGLDFVIGRISKAEAMKPDFVKTHKINCRYYGIPPYIGGDKDLRKIYSP